MKLSSEWLNEITEQKANARQQGELLERAGIELEQIISSTRLDKNIVVVEVKKVVQHPNADRLKLVQVSDGSQQFNIVCGAPNCAEGQIAALALPGAVLPDGTKIKQATIRGEESNGMLCSAMELGMSGDHSGILELDSATPVGSTLCDIWDSGEVLDLTSAYNRPDLLSAIGIGRELAAFSGKRLGEPDFPEVKGKVSRDLLGDIDKNVVKRYLLAHVKLGKTMETPSWMKERLLASGVRPIGVVVDITNYVLLETGQPLHAFDARNVTLPISVRLPRRGGEKLTTLDGVDRPLSPDDAIIADARTPLALAGVMGGLASEIVPETIEILLESATFDSRRTRETAVRHGLRTEASARFERSLPAEYAGVGLRRALQLLAELCDAELMGVSEDFWKPQELTVVTLSPERISALLGMPVKADKAKQQLELLGFDVKLGESMVVTVPWWRTDVRQEADVVEEVSRMLGYDDLPATLPAWQPKHVHFDKRFSRIWQLKSVVRGLGIDEVVTYSFVSHDQLSDFGHSHEKHLKLKNPMSVEQAYIRSTLAPSLVNVVARNARNIADVSVFEISKVFQSKDKLSELPNEPLYLGVAVHDKHAYSRVKAAVDLINREFKLGLVIVPKDNNLYSPGRSAEITRNGKSLGWLGELNAGLLQRHKLRGAVGYLEMDIESWIEDETRFNFSQVSRFPSIVRDLSLVLDQNVAWADVVAVISGTNLLNVEFLNDYYGKELGEGKKALAARLTFGSQERTLTDDEADQAAGKIAKELERKFGAKLRD